MSKKVFIIAEAGDNHNGDVSLAYKLIDEAKKAGADAVKFQTFITEEIICKDYRLYTCAWHFIYRTCWL